MKSSPPKSGLTQESLRDTIRYASPLIVGDLYEASQELARFADARRATIETKAASLLTASGLCVTLLSATIGATVRPDFQSTLCLKIIVTLTLGAGCLAGFCSLMALKVRSDHVTVDPIDLFRKDAFAVPSPADTAPEPPTADTDPAPEPPSDDLKSKEDQAHWRGYLAVHLVGVAEKNAKIAEEKARSVSCGQWALSGLIFGMFLIGIIFVTGHANDQKAAPSAPASAPASQRG